MRRLSSPPLLALVLLIAAGMTAFLVARQLASGSPGTRAAPDDAPSRIDVDRAKAKFEGELNGFNFYDPDKSPPRQPPACSALPGGGQEASKEEIEASSLNFSVANLPPGAQLTFEGGNKCGNAVVAIVRNYGSKGGPQLIVARIAASPDIPVEAPIDRLQAATVAGRPAVIVSPVFDGDRSAIYMRDGVGYWMVSGVHTTPDVVTKVAEAVR